MVDSFKEVIWGLWTKERVSASKTGWLENAQTGELHFHKTNDWRSTPDFMHNTILLFESFGYDKTQFDGKVIADLGAGSRLRSKFSLGAKIVAIEPLADRCVSDIAWCDLQDAWKVYSKPAEEFIPELENSIDFLFSINVLDHCYDFPRIIENVYKYMKGGAECFLSFDEHRYTDKMHPLILSDKICCDIFTNTGFTIKKKSNGFAGEFARIFNTSTYGHGRYCLNYWLIKG